MSNGEYDTTFDLSEICDRLQRPDRNDNGPTSLVKLLNRAGSHSNSSVVFSDFKIRYFPKTQNEIADSLGRNARYFHRSFFLSIVLFRSGYPNHLKFL
ncbi:hypothetical protein Bca4012_045039 [Brassica carinata]